MLVRNFLAPKPLISPGETYASREYNGKGKCFRISHWSREHALKIFGNTADVISIVLLVLHYTFFFFHCVCLPLKSDHETPMPTIYLRLRLNFYEWYSAVTSRLVTLNRKFICPPRLLSHLLTDNYSPRFTSAWGNRENEGTRATSNFNVPNTPGFCVYSGTPRLKRNCLINLWIVSH